MARTTPRVRVILDRFKKMEAEKANFVNLWQLAAEYVMYRKQEFTGDKAEGQILTDHIYDTTAIKALSIMASSFIGALWPNGAKSFRISMPHNLEEEIGGETEEIKQYYEFVTRQMVEYMDHPKAGLTSALEEYMLDQGAFGTSGIQVFEEDDMTAPVRYKATDAKMLYIDEDRTGFVDTIYMKKKMTIRQMVQEYGFDNLSASRQKAFKEGDVTTKVDILHAIEPRMDYDPFSFGNKDYPIASIHIDIETQKILRESGFLELPVAVARFYKAMGEKYGRSPATAAMPTILEANSMGQAYILAIEKTLDPALLVMDDGTMGGLTIDTSPGGTTVVSVSGRMSGTQKPIQELFSVGDLQWTAARRQELTEEIKNHFFLDRLMDLNSEQRMQNPEVAIRNELRGQALNTVYTRQLTEMFVPIIETTFNKLRRRGFLGVIPGSQEELDLINAGIIPKYIPEPVIRRMLTGQEVYKIEFISPAVRIKNSEELSGIEHLLTTSLNLSPVDPSIFDNIDLEWTLRRIQELDGAPREVLVSLEKLQQIKQDRQQMEAQMMEMEAARQNSETARNMGQAMSSVKDSNAA